LFAQNLIDIENIVPAPNSWASKTSRIMFDIVGHNTIDISTVHVWVMGDAAWTGGAFVAPYSGVTDFATGRRLRFEIASTDPWPWQTNVSVRVVASDMFGNGVDETWEFSGDSGPPYILWGDPWYGGRLEGDGYLNFFVTDDNAGVDGSTLDAYVGGEWAVTLANWPTPIFKAPYNGPLSDAYQDTRDGMDGYHITLQRTSPYTSGHQWNLRVLSDDRLGRHQDQTWLLNTMPYVEIVSPADGSHNNAPHAQMEFWILDDGYLLQSSIDAYASGTLVIEHGTIVTGWTFFAGEITPGTHDGYDGYHVILVPSPAYGNNWPTNCEMRIMASDSDGYTMDSRSWEFHTDNTAPNLENMSPAPGSSRQPLDSLVVFDVVDHESHVDSNNLSVEIDEGDGAVTAYTHAGGFVSPYDGGSSSVAAITDGYRVTIQKTEEWETSWINIAVQAYDHVGNVMDDGWEWNTGWCRFDLRAQSGAAKSGHKMTAGTGGAPTWPSFAYNAASCVAASWPAWDGYGNTLTASGSGSTRLNAGSPLNSSLDDSVVFDGSRTYRNYDGDVTTHDFAVELLVRTPPKSSGHGYIVRKGFYYPGWNISVEDAPADPYGWVGKRIRCTMGSASSQFSVVSNTLWYDTWYHVQVLAERNGYLCLIVNGDIHSSSYIGSLDAVSLTTTHGLVISEARVALAFIRFWTAENLVGGGFGASITRRFRQICGANPQTAGLDTEAQRDRASFKNLDSKGYVHRVGENWIGTCMRTDASVVPTWREGLLIEDATANYCGKGDFEFGDYTQGKWYGYLGWSIWRPLAPNRVSDALYCFCGNPSVFTYASSWEGSGPDRVVYSAYVKPSRNNYLYLRLDAFGPVLHVYGTYSVWLDDPFYMIGVFDLTGAGSAAIYDYHGGSLDPQSAAEEAGIERLSDGWYRIWVSGPYSKMMKHTPGYALTPRIQPCKSLTDLSAPSGSYSPGDVWFWFWGPQIERSVTNKPSSLFDWAHDPLYPTRDREPDDFAFYSSYNCWDGYGRLRAEVVGRNVGSELATTETPVVLTDLVPPTGRISLDIGVSAADTRFVDGAADTTLTGSGDILDGDIHSIEAAYDSLGADLIVDNAVEASGAPDVPSTTSGYIYIGSDRLTAGHCPDLAIRRVKIWNKE
jgi:hypothetical protein